MYAGRRSGHLQPSGDPRPGATSSVTTLVRVTARAGAPITVTATVAPSDATPGDNTAADRTTVLRR